MKTKRELPRRTYRYTDAELLQISDKFINSAKRDISEFEKYGYSEIILSEIMAERELFANIESDTEMLANIIDLNDEKDKCRNRVIGTIKTILVRVEIKSGEESSIYRRASISNISKLTDEELSRETGRMINLIKPIMADYADVGLDNSMMRDATAWKGKLERTMESKAQAEKDREIKTIERIEEGNKLYKMICKVSAIGKDIWYTKSEAKYNDYLLCEK